MKKYLPFFLIFIFTTIFCFPILKDINIFTNRGNDLTEFFWPIFYFTKINIVNNHQLPFWNNLFFSGTALLPDPQSPLFYIPNILFLFFKSLDTGFLVSIFIHIFFAGIGMYFLSKNGFNFSKKTSLFCSFIYVASPKLSGFIEAGHFGLITSWAWLPFAVLSVILLAKKPTLKKSVFLSITLSGLFYTHILVFAITTISISILFLYLIAKDKKNIAKKIIHFLIAGIITFGLTAIALLPQLSWQNITTRSLLLNSPDVYPKWYSKIEFAKASISPVIFGSKFIWGLDTEKTVALGIFTSIFVFFGFIKLKTRNKYLIEVSLLIPLLISLNNISPFYDFLIKQNWYILLRVSTRFWFIIVFIFIFLAGYGFERLARQNKLKFLVNTLAFLAITELLLTSWTKILKPVVKDANLASESIYELISQDKTLFRVFCLNRCLSQKKSAIYGLQLAEGYGTLQQKNYYEESEQLSQSFYRNRYTLSIPPFEIFNYENLQPYSPNLSIFNIKYVISKNPLKDKNLSLIKVSGKYLIYENMINRPRSNYPIIHYSPNLIKIDTSNFTESDVILSEIFNPDWKAYSNGNKELKISETPDKTREVTIDKNTKFVDFIYQPKSLKIGLAITISTISVIALLIGLQYVSNERS